MIGVKNSRFP